MMDRSIALVTGASRGIGRAIAVELAQQGLFVIVNYHANEQAAAEVRDRIDGVGGRCALSCFDVSDREQVEPTIRELTREHGMIEVIVNNAGILHDQPLVRLGHDDWDRVIQTNLNGVYHCTRAVLRTWAGKQPRGRIVNVTSVIGERGNAYQTNYAASKAGIIGFTKSLAREVAARGITANAVAPGFVAGQVMRIDGGLHI
jgi:3-oxoacyl-[acyl-carrier protein] reductase